jgi:hypothetical protein
LANLIPEAPLSLRLRYRAERQRQAESHYHSDHCLPFVFSFFKICITARLFSMCGDGSPLSYTDCRSEWSVSSFGQAGIYCRPLLDKVGKNNGGIVLPVIAPAQS